jgi:hypothetical protein
MYVAPTLNNDASLRAPTWHKRFLVEGAREHALPPAYIATLENPGSLLVSQENETDATDRGS